MRQTVKASFTSNITLLTELLSNLYSEAREHNWHVKFIKWMKAELRQLDKYIFDVTEDDAVENELVGAADYSPPRRSFM